MTLKSRPLFAMGSLQRTHHRCPATINATSLNALLTSIEAANTTLCALAAVIVTSQEKWLKLYYDPAGFRVSSKR